MIAQAQCALGVVCDNAPSDQPWGIVATILVVVTFLVFYFSD